jgi:hypothetical protein
MIMEKFKILVYNNVPVKIATAYRGVGEMLSAAVSDLTSCLLAQQLNAVDMLITFHLEAS